MQLTFKNELSAFLARYGYELDVEKAIHMGILSSLPQPEIQNGSFSIEAMKLAIQGRITDPQYSAWIDPLRLKSTNKGQIVLEAENEFSASWARERYLPLIVEIVGSSLQLSEPVSIEIVAKPQFP